jgi:hypothetical protein
MNESRIQSLRAERATLLAYLRCRVDNEDWHGVSDAANDIREIEREIRVLLRLEN